MSSKRNKTNYTGVYAREHESRRYRGKPDVCYDICFRLPGERKLIWEKVGWLSEKVTASMASHVRAERLKHARKVDNLPADNARLTLDEVFVSDVGFNIEKYLTEKLGKCFGKQRTMHSSMEQGKMSQLVFFIIRMGQKLGW